MAFRAVLISLVHESNPLSVAQTELSGWWHDSSWRRVVALASGRLLLSSVRCHCTATRTGRYIASSRRGPLCGPVEKLWREFFSDPSQWWDHRSEKVNLRYPDFKHKKTQQSLWLCNDLTPPWVEAKLATVAPRSLQANIFSWNQRLQRYAKGGDYKKTLELFQQLQQEGIHPNKFTFIPLLNACAHLGVLEEGRRIHKKIIEDGLESDVYLASSLVDMYGKCGSIEDAQRVFNKMPSRDVVCWTAMIIGYVKCGKGQNALELAREMYRQGVEPDRATLLGLLSACASVYALEEGRLVHEQIIRRGYESDVFVGSSLVDLYSKCGSVEDAGRVFNKMPTRDVVAWNAMILGYVKCGKGQKALDLSRQMFEEGVEPDPTTFVGVLNACASVGALEEGRLAHEQIVWRGYESDVFVGSSLVDMYVKCGSIEDAKRVFNKMPSRNVVSWTSMILGCVKYGQGQNALDLSQQMCAEGVEPNTTTFVGVLNACASVAALEEGRLVHKQIIQRSYETDVFVGNSLVDMYAKCGSIEDAEIVFNKLHTRTVATWNAMLAGYAMHGQARAALEHIERMCKDVEVNDVTFVCLLSACSHGGLIEEGLYYFESLMREVYNISPTKDHYACVVDLLGRAGHLHKAEDLISSMPWEPDATMLMSLLGACRVHGNLEMGESVGKWVLELEPQRASGYVLLSNIYSAAGTIEVAEGCESQYVPD